MHFPAPRITVVGSINADIMIDVASLPLPHQTIAAHGLRRTMGGKGLNQAVAAARMDAAVTIIAAVGGDEEGRAARAHLERRNVNTDGIVTVPGAGTGIAHILVAQDGGNMIAVSAGANARLTPAHIAEAEAAIAAADLLLVQLETPIDTVRAALLIARRHGVRTILNPAPADRLAVELLPLVDLVTPNDTELQVLAETHAQAPEAGLAKLLEAGAGAALVTLGVEGSLALDRRGALVQPAFPVAVVDTVGAGDVYNGVLALALASGEALAGAMRLAAAAAALSVTRASADAAPTREEVELFLAG